LAIVGPLFFIIFINDIVTEIHSSIKLFADDTSLYVIVDKESPGVNPDWCGVIILFLSKKL
jgi:hypothetical protein